MCNIMMLILWLKSVSRPGTYARFAENITLAVEPFIILQHHYSHTLFTLLYRERCRTDRERQREKEATSQSTSSCFWLRKAQKSGKSSNHWLLKSMVTCLEF